MKNISYCGINFNFINLISNEVREKLQLQALTFSRKHLTKNETDRKVKGLPFFTTQDFTFSVSFTQCTQSCQKICLHDNPKGSRHCTTFPIENVTPLTFFIKR